MAIPGSVVAAGKLITPGGAQGPLGGQGPAGPTAVSTDAGNQAVLGSDSKIYVPDPTPQITSVRLRSFNSIGNPNFEVDQKQAGTSRAVNLANTPFVDRWYCGAVGSWAATGQQMSAVGSELVVPGTSFQISRSYLRVTLTTAQASLGTTDKMFLYQNLEGIQFRELQYDVHSAQLLVRSSVVGLKFGLSLQDPTASRSLAKLCTIPANTWTLITMPNLPLCPSAGTFSSAAGVLGYNLEICLAAGANLTTPANDTWQSGNFIGALGQSNFAASALNSTFDIAFIQHEPGAVCSTLMDKPFSQNLSEAQRYFQKSYDYATAVGGGIAAGAVYAYNMSTAQPYNFVPFKCTMAKVPTVTAYSTGGAANFVRNVTGAVDVASGAVNAPGVNGFSGFNATAPASVWLSSYHYTADTGW